MKSMITVAVIAAGLSSALLTGCDPVVTSTAAGTTPIHLTPVREPSSQGTQGPLGSTLKVTASDGTSYSEFTASNPRIVNGNTRLDFVVKDVQGAESLGVDTISVMNSAGRRVKTSDSFLDGATNPGTGELDQSSAMVPGEVRTGYLDFAMVDPAEVYVQSFLGSDAIWTVK